MVVSSLLKSFKSRLINRSYLFLLFSNSSVLIVGNLASSGITASEPHVIEKWVSPIDFLDVVRYDHRTWGSSSTHFPLALSNLFFSPPIITLLVASACPLLCRKTIVEYLFGRLCYRTRVCCPRWECVAWQILWQCSAIRTSSHLGLKCWRGVLLQPIL